MKQVTQHTVPLIEITPIHRDLTDADQATTEIEVDVVNWYRRVTGVLSGLFLLFALSFWIARPGHYRGVMILLTIAMMAAILHSYDFEDGQQP